jgi:hypothetical protein
LRSLFLHACAILITLLGTTFGQQATPLRVTLSFDQTTYALNSEAVIDVLLTNTSGRPIFVYSHAEDTALHDSITPPPTLKR